MQNKIENETQITVFDNFADGNIEVLFQDEVKLDVEVSLFYIKSGQEEIQYYVDNISIPQIESFTVTKIEDIKENINSYIEETTKPEIDEYVETEIIPSLDEYKTQTAADAQSASASSLAAEQSAASASSSASSAAQSAQEAEAAAQEAIEKSSFGNIGDIKYTMRTDVPNGGAWCDGTEYTQAMFPDIYQMLVDGKISSTDFTTFDDSVTNNGSCGFFALDTATTSFKVPLLKDVYIKAGDAPAMFVAESLPNITGTLGASGAVAWQNPTGAFSLTGKTSTKPNASDADPRPITLNFNASLSSSVYQNNAKVNPDHVVYRAYVVLYSSAAEASEAQAAEFIQGLVEKANTDFSNVLFSTLNHPDRWVKIGNLLIQWGSISVKSGTTGGTVTLQRPFANTGYMVTALRSATEPRETIPSVGAKTTTSFPLYFYGAETSGGFNWIAIGEGA